MLNLAVFSTSVEVFLKELQRKLGEPSLLHVRGGVSAAIRIIRCFGVSSPRPWRCFILQQAHRQAAFVFSTSVEVFPERCA